MTEGRLTAVAGEASGASEATAAPEEELRQRIGGLGDLLGLDYSNVETSPDKYKVRKPKNKDIKRLKEILLDALEKMQKIQAEAAAVDAENEPNREWIRSVIERNIKADERGEDPISLPNVTIKPDPNTGLQIGRMILGDIMDRVIFNEDSWLASLLDEEVDKDELDMDWYVSVLEALIEKYDLPNLLARHLRFFQAFSNALRTKSVSATAAPNSN
jgi:hypothetical protein